MVFVLVIALAWLATSSLAVVLCVAARRTDNEIAGPSAPVIKITALGDRRHTAA